MFYELKRLVIMISFFALGTLGTVVHATDFPMSPIQFPSSMTVNAMSQIGQTYDDENSSDDLNLNFNATPQATNFDPTYKISKSVRKANLEKFVERTRSVDPTGAKQMQQIFASTDVIEDIGQGIAQYGLSVNNVADAHALYWINAWQAANGQYGDPSNDQIALVQMQSANALVSTPEFLNASNALKQEMSEAYLLQAVMIAQYMDLAKNDPKLKPQIAAAVRKGAKASGLDLDAMTLTDEGFVPARKGSDASDAVPPGPGEEAEAIADAGVATDDTTTYALIAAAGAGTLAAAFGLGKVMGRRG